MVTKKRDVKRSHKAIRDVVVRFGELGYKPADHPAAFDTMVKVHYRDRMHEEYQQYLNHMHFKHCYMGDQCDGSCNDYCE